MAIYHKGKKIAEVKVTQVIHEGVNTTDATATSEDIAFGQTAYVNGEKVVGSNQIAAYDDQIAVTYGTLSLKDGNEIVVPNLKAENIKKGVTILGVTGTYEGE